MTKQKPLRNQAAELVGGLKCRTHLSGVGLNKQRNRARGNTVNYSEVKIIEELAISAGFVRRPNLQRGSQYSSPAP